MLQEVTSMAPSPGLFNKDPKVILIVGATPTLQGLI